MKRCPKCRRDYFDDSLTFCLDDGAHLLEGPALDGPPTAVLPTADPSSEAATRTFDDTKAEESVRQTTATRKSMSWIAVGAIAILLAAVLAWVGYNYYGRGSSKQIDSIAVMPFVNAGGDPEIEYLSDGITESLINSLSQIPNLSVKARSSVFTYKGKEVAPQQVAKDLSVQAVLNGRVLQRGDQVVLNVELVDAATGNHIWGEQYTHAAADLVRLPSTIAGDVSGKLRAKLTGAEQQNVAKNYTQNAQAYELYLRGRHHWNKRTPDDIRKSVEYFQKAIDVDPTYALAYAALAESYVLVANYRIGAPGEYYPKAKAAVTRALEIDDTLAEAHNALATTLSNRERRFADAEAEWRRAIELNPSYASAHHWYSEFLLSMGRRAEALAEIRRARELDPLSLIINGMLGITLNESGQPEEALQQLNKTVEMDPNFPRTYLYLTGVYERLERFEEAADAFARYAILSGRPREAVEPLLARVKAAARTGGSAGYSRAMAEILESRSKDVPPVVVAGYWVGAGETEKALNLLEKAFQDQDESLLALKDHPFDPIKNDPRYKDLLRRVGLPE